MSPSFEAYAKESLGSYWVAFRDRGKRSVLNEE